MKKPLLIILGILVLAVAYWLISPLFITKQVNETIENLSAPVAEPGAINNQPKVIAAGAFRGLAGHNARGATKFLEFNGKYFVRFEDDFNVTNGPDLFVYFGKDGRYVAEAKIDRLKGNVGGQNYEVPEGLNPKDYNEVWVWCRAFSVPFGQAVLTKTIN